MTWKLVTAPTPIGYANPNPLCVVGTPHAQDYRGGGGRGTNGHEPGVRSMQLRARCRCSRSQAAPRGPAGGVAGRADL